jgi:hypothetical protein
MLAFDFDQLSALGLTPALANRAAGLATPGSAPMNCCASPWSTGEASSSTTALPSAPPARCRASCAL